MINAQIKGIKINGKVVEQNLSQIVSHMLSPNGTDFLLKVTDNGELYAEKLNHVEPLDKPTGPTKKEYSDHIFINSLYCGGIGDEINEHTTNYCSHNFVELSNLTDKDINLEGLSLQYDSENGNDWKVLPLHGVIKSGSTFVVRGAQCSSLNSPTTKIHVDNYDMEWKVNNELIQFSIEKGKFYLCFSLEKAPSNPYSELKNKGVIGYIDLVGFNGSKTTDGFENNARTNLSNKVLFKKYYSMDKGAKAIKKLAKRNNLNDWNYVDLTKDDGEVIRSINAYTPKASFEDKTLFYDKTDLDMSKPSMITCSFGIQATDNGSGATRCFNWLSGTLDAKYIWIKKAEESEWGDPHMTFYEGDGRTVYINDIYNRIIKEYTNNRTIVANKFIINGLTSGKYEYIAGCKNENGTPNLERCTEVFSFNVRTNEDVNENGFTFVQTTDQQGFNWDEYQVWKATATLISKETDESKPIDFMINTGDMTQDGNRLYEWLDYFDGKKGFTEWGKKNYLANMEEMATIGNNDLSLRELYSVSKGDDDDKLWLENITFFYTFEVSEGNSPIFEMSGNSYYMPSLYSFNYGNTHFMCVNSEIKMEAETSPKAYNFGGENYGNFYPKIKEWCEKDIANNTQGTTNRIAFCHEMPFTILTYWDTVDPTKTKREGSSLNINLKSENEKYWFSEFCQKNNIKLVIGGHKHTQATSYPLLENVSYDDDERNVDSMHPIIVVDKKMLETNFSGATYLTTLTGTEYKYPNTWFDEEGEIKADLQNHAKLCCFKMLDSIEGKETPVVYAMSQSSGYKHTSNKELPSPILPWLRYYYECRPGSDKSAGDTPNAEQKYPFYTLWNISKDKIVGNVRKAYGIFNETGKFDINVEGPLVKQGLITIKETKEYKTPIYSKNGIKPNASDEIIEITL